MSLMIVDSGFWTTVQDRGRVGYREWGVPVGGAFDRASADVANALVGNDVDCAVLELTLRGGTFEALGSLGIALAGAPMEAFVHDLEDRCRQLRIPCSTTLQPGERLVLGRVLQGVRSYLAVSRGILTRPRLGSRSSEQPLQRGDFLRTAESCIPTRHLPEFPRTDPASQPIRIVDGPDARLLDGRNFWMHCRFVVGSRGNRMGLRLQGAPIELACPTDRLSAPVAPGTVQVAGGQLIILGVASGTMGGYPHVAQVISADLDRIAQLRPGESVRFQRVTLQDARRMDEESRRAHRGYLARLAAMARDR
jgi:biotin-dependent carboxylase-like uncharacterized protein